MVLPPPLKAVVVNGKKKIAVNGVVNINIPQGGGSSSGVQPDWNQNDEGAPDFIKNRVCSESYGNIFGQTFTINENGNIGESAEIYLNPITPILSNSEYKLLINGEVQKISTPSGAPDGRSGYISFSFESGGCSIFWDMFGLADAPNHEIIKITFNCDPTLYTGKTVEFNGQIIKTLDDKYIGFGQYGIVRMLDIDERLGGTVRFKKVGTDLKASLDGGSTWKTVTLT